MAQLISQIIGSFSVTAATAIAASVLFLAVNATKTLRVSPEGELLGLDIHEHGAIAYPEYALLPSERHPLEMYGVKVKKTKTATASAPAGK